MFFESDSLVVGVPDNFFLTKEDDKEKPKLTKETKEEKKRSKVIKEEKNITTEMTKPLLPSWCQNPLTKGADYRGTIDTTTKGKTCQMWSATSPHNHSFTNVGHHNYCRNPYSEDWGLWDYVWCYTTDPWKEWDYCDVPFCSLS